MWYFEKSTVVLNEILRICFVNEFMNSEESVVVDVNKEQFTAVRLRRDFILLLNCGLNHNKPVAEQWIHWAMVCIVA